MLDSIEAILNDNCGCCGKKFDMMTFNTWNCDDSSINLSRPPKYLRYISICHDCYNDTNGPIMEQKILEYLAFIGLKLYCPNKTTKDDQRVVMPNGVDGYICVKCNEFYSYVESNQPDGSYICRSHIKIF